MPNTRQAYVELNFKETSRSGDCNLLEWNESEAVLKDVKLEGGTTFANIFFSEEGATTPALFGTLEEMLTRIGKHERWQYGKERAETRVEAVEKAVFEILTEIDKAILGARQVARQVEAFYAGK